MSMSRDFLPNAIFSVGSKQPRRAVSARSPSPAVPFCDEDALLLETLSRFIGTALAAGQAAIVIATRAHRDGLEKLLNTHGLDIGNALAEGRYVSLEASDVLAQVITDGRLDEDRFTAMIRGLVAQAGAAAHGGPRVAAFGEMVALLMSRGQGEAGLRVEQLWNGLAQEKSATGFYRDERAETFLNICAEQAATDTEEHERTAARI